VSGGIRHAGSVLLHVGYVVGVRLGLVGCTGNDRLVLVSADVIDGMIWTFPAGICHASNVISHCLIVFNDRPPRRPGAIPHRTPPYRNPPCRAPPSRTAPSTLRLQPLRVGHRSDRG
jgi:hypothetical protein